jgi:hypothetical protein
MKIRIEPHTVKRANERGASEDEITETTTDWPANSSERKQVGEIQGFSFSTKKKWQIL